MGKNSNNEKETRMASLAPNNISEISESDSTTHIDMDEVNDILNDLDELTIDFDVSIIIQLKIELIDVLGKQVYTNILTPENKTINLENLQKGMYFMLLSEGNNSVVKKILLK